jgi:hypothetical protein
LSEARDTPHGFFECLSLLAYDDKRTGSNGEYRHHSAQPREAEFEQWIQPS